MLKAIIKNQQNIVTNEKIFVNNEELQSWVSEQEQYNAFPENFQLQIENVASELEQKQINEQAEKYLKETDWYILREVDEEHLVLLK